MSDIDVMDPEIVNVNDTEKKLQQPKMYQVIFINDDFTPMEFVKDVLQQFHGKKLEEALIITDEVHTQGKAIAGVYTHEIAETKVHQVNMAAQKNEPPYPLQTTMEPLG
jgi:ATP-dependent Clp protease adaptor protein ClpS